MKYPHQDMPLDDLCAALHKQGATWFNNRDLLLLEELIRRAKLRSNAGATPGDDNGKRESVRDVQAGNGSDVRPGPGDPGYEIGRPLTTEEIKTIEAHARYVYESSVGWTHPRSS